MRRITPGADCAIQLSRGNWRHLHKVPRSLQRLALEIDGWLDFRSAEHALKLLDPLLASPGARPVGLVFRIRSYLLLAKWEEALQDIDELRELPNDPEWLDLTEAWCMKRVGNLRGSIGCMERLLKRSRRSAIGHFNLGCYLALLGDSDRAIDAISVACGIEEQFRKLASNEKDLESVAEDPRFLQLLPHKENEDS